jgi:hypothetical protein
MRIAPTIASMTMIAPNGDRRPPRPGRSVSDQESPLPGSPTVPRAPRRDRLTVAPGRPTLRLAPVFERLIRRPRASRI